LYPLARRRPDGELVLGVPVGKNEHTDIGMYGKGEIAEPDDYQDEGQEEPHGERNGEGEPEIDPDEIDIDNNKETVYAAHDRHHGCCCHCRPEGLGPGNKKKGDKDRRGQSGDEPACLRAVTFRKYGAHCYPEAAGNKGEGKFQDKGGGHHIEGSAKHVAVSIWLDRDPDIM